MALRIAFVALIAALAAHLVLPDGMVREGLYYAIGLGSAALIATRGTAWRFLAAGIVFMLIGEVVYPTPSYLAMFVSIYTALVLLLRGRLHPFPLWLTLDGILAGLTLAALATLNFGTLRELTGDDDGTLAVSLANVVADLLMLVVVVVAFAATNWRPGRTWWLLAAALMLATAADMAWMFGHELDSLWCATLIVGAFAAWQPSSAPGRPYIGWAMGSVPLVGSGVSILTLYFGGIVGAAPLTLSLAAAALVAALGRAILMLRENFQLLRTARREALTDKLTDLPNRRALLHDLGKDAGTRSLLFFDLDGFKDYNDAFGHPAGDALLRRLAPRLARVGRAYRLGGDEFCLLVPGALSNEHPVVVAAVEALSEHGDGFTIGASHGLVVLPDDARDATEALRLADERMYARKRRRRGNQARDLLVGVMAERDGRHDSIAELAAAVGRRLGLSAEELDVLIRAAELHDVGTVAVPDGILRKAGPLDPAEWEVMRQHTVAGERILAAAESLRPVARLVRAAHERWDGLGYPDGLRGEEIPLGARIICACDAYDAMVRGRPYSEALSPAAAVAELRRCAGTQFDPRVVETLTQVCQGFATLAVSGRADDQRGG